MTICAEFALSMQSLHPVLVNGGAAGVFLHETHYNFSHLELVEYVAHTLQFREQQ